MVSVFRKYELSLQITVTVYSLQFGPTKEQSEILQFAFPDCSLQIICTREETEVLQFAFPDSSLQNSRTREEFEALQFAFPDSRLLISGTNALHQRKISGFTACISRLQFSHHPQLKEVLCNSAHMMQFCVHDALLCMMQFCV